MLKDLDNSFEFSFKLDKTQKKIIDGIGKRWYDGRKER